MVTIGEKHEQDNPELENGDPDWDEGYDDDENSRGTFTDCFSDVPPYVDDFVDGLPRGAELLSIHDILYGYSGIPVPRRAKKWLNGLPHQYQGIPIGYIGGSAGDDDDNSAPLTTS